MSCYQEPNSQIHNILIHKNQCNTDKQNLKKKLKMSIKMSDVSGLVTIAVLNTNIKEVHKKYLTLVV